MTVYTPETILPSYIFGNNDSSGVDELLDGQDRKGTIFTASYDMKVTQIESFIDKTIPGESVRANIFNASSGIIGDLIISSDFFIPADHPGAWLVLPLPCAITFVVGNQYAIDIEPDISKAVNIWRQTKTGNSYRYSKSTGLVTYVNTIQFAIRATTGIYTTYTKETIPATVYTPE